MTVTLHKMIISNLEISVDPNDEAVSRLAEMSEALEQAENGGIVSTTTSSLCMADERLEPSKPVNPASAAAMHRFLTSPVSERTRPRADFGDF
jgi:hypothetical protein